MLVLYVHLTTLGQAASNTCLGSFSLSIYVQAKPDHFHLRVH